MDEKYHKWWLAIIFIMVLGVLLIIIGREVAGHIEPGLPPIGNTRLTGYGVSHNHQINWLESGPPEAQTMVNSPNPEQLTQPRYFLGFQSQNGQHYCLEVTQEQWHNTTAGATIDQPELQGQPEPHLCDSPPHLRP